jgi:16S rRNA G966 N2-methylase RsmD
VARAADFDLANELAKPSFTPGRGDARALVELVVRGDEPTAARAATALAKLGEVARTTIEGRLRTRDDSPVVPHDPRRGRKPEIVSLDEMGRARLVGALGLLARGGDEVARGELIARLADDSVRVRRTAVNSLGKLASGEHPSAELADVRAALLARWDAADVPPDERRALAEALGKVGGDEALARLRALETVDDGELARRRDRALLMADRTARRGDSSEIATDVPPPAPLTVHLRCRPGLGQLLLGELGELDAHGFSPRALGDHGAAVTLAGPWSTLFASRLWATAAIRIDLVRGRTEDPEQLASAIVETLVAPGTRALLQAWTRGPIRWRLGFAHGHRRAVVWRVARDVTAAAPELVNDPAATTWEVLVDDQAWTLELVPRRASDPRFAWRVAEVPAASHPSVAAALAFASDLRDSDRVWDPFCGAGAELVECARRGAKKLVGSDLDPTALEAARANLAAASVHAELVSGDARSHEAGPVDVIVTNPPLGSRVKLDAAALLVAALPHFARTLAPGGRLVWITPARRKTTPVAEQLGLRRVLALNVDLGGVRGQLERWDR